jgi:ribosome biogenesis SPOUT family RNA methylase Rps3
MIYVIEHLDKRLFPWCLLEYKSISETVGKANLLFTRTSSRLLVPLGRVTRKSAAELRLKNACVLDPFAKKTLCSKDSFDHLIFGGILGDEPMQRRTERELTVPLGVTSRNLGPMQMSTDTAVYVAKRILDGEMLSDIKFCDEIEIRISKEESVVLPFRYALVDGKPRLAPGLVEHLKRRRAF